MASQKGAKQEVSQAPQQVQYSQPVYMAPSYNKAKWLTLEYALAMFSVVVSALLTVQVMGSVFILWSKGISSFSSASSVTGWLVNVLGAGMYTPGTGIIAVAFVALFFAVLAFVCFGRVSRAIPEREGYTKRTAYKIVTYATFAAIFIPSVVLLAKLATILISSLVFIGAGGSGEVYKSLYLAEFLPYLLGLAIFAAVLWFVKEIISGKNSSKILSLILVVASAVTLLAGTITIAIQVRSVASSLDKTSSKSLYDYGKSTTCKKYGIGCD